MSSSVNNGLFEMCPSMKCERVFLRRSDVLWEHSKCPNFSQCWSQLEGNGSWGNLRKRQWAVKSRRGFSIHSLGVSVLYYVRRTVPHKLTCFVHMSDGILRTTRQFSNLFGYWLVRGSAWWAQCLMRKSFRSSQWAHQNGGGDVHIPTCKTRSSRTSKASCGPVRTNRVLHLVPVLGSVESVPPGGILHEDQSRSESPSEPFGIGKRSSQYACW